MLQPPDFRHDYSHDDYDDGEEEECKETARFGGAPDAVVSPFDSNHNRAAHQRGDETSTTIFDFSAINKPKVTLQKLYKESSEFEHYSAGTVRQINYGVLMLIGRNSRHQKVDILCQHLSTGFVLL